MADESVVGADETKRLMAEGAAASVDDALAKVHIWVRSA